MQSKFSSANLITIQMRTEAKHPFHSHSAHSLMCTHPVGSLPSTRDMHAPDYQCHSKHQSGLANTIQLLQTSAASKKTNQNKAFLSKE